MINYFEELKVKILSIIMIVLPVGKLLGYVLFLSNVIDDPFKVKHVLVLWIAIPILIFLYLYGLYKKKDNFNYLDIINISLVVLAFISTIFAINIKVSFLGENRRYEGLFSLISYYLIFLNAKSIKKKESKEKLINVFLYLGLFQVAYSLIQVYSDWGIVRRADKVFLAMGLCGNPNFLASYMAMLVILSSTLFIKNKDKKYFVLAIIYNVGLVLAESTGPFLAVIITLIFIVIYFHKKEYVKRTLLLGFALLITFILTNTSSMFVQEKVFNHNIPSQYNIVSEILDTVKKVSANDEKIEELGHGRIRIWSILLPKVKNYWLVGAGIDNIAYVYPQSGNQIVDKAHNQYLQILITNGLPALILYCALSLIIFIKGLKLKNDDIALYMLFVVYSIQAFTNISVIDVAPYFFLFFGLLASNFNKKLLEEYKD